MARHHTAAGGRAIARTAVACRVLTGEPDAIHGAVGGQRAQVLDQCLSSDPLSVIHVPEKRGPLKGIEPPSGYLPGSAPDLTHRAPLI
jgi:hypothetical protein